jgi:Ca2+-transporting ATPase
MGQSLYQVVVMVFLMFFGGLVFFEESFNLITEPSNSTKRLTLDTICFHTFILMNLFNSINCRLVDTKDATELNIFKTILNNPTFWIVFAIEFFIQDLMVSAGRSKVGAAFFGTAELT